MGRVYKAVDLELKQQIAIKVIRSDIVDIPGVLSRFKREVNATRVVTHANVCRTFDLETHTPSEAESGGLGTPITFLTMELLVGETLAQRIHRTGPLPSEEVRVFAIQIARALQAAHSAGVIHCDLKPSNIFLSGALNDPRVVVTDFGIAKLIRSQEQTLTSSLTASGLSGSAAVGTPFYMAPEQIETGDCSPASDLYSFGLVIYEALTAQKLSPYRRSLNEIETTLGRLPFLPGTEQLHAIEPAWVDIIARCVQPNPNDRFENAEQLLNSLEPGPRSLPANLPADRTNFGSAVKHEQ
jgi:serine/threonine protein kinase